jgi:hypothetical protein
MDLLHAIHYGAGAPLLCLGLCITAMFPAITVGVKLAEFAWMQLAASGACVFAAVCMGSV